jgi:DNA-binding NtrC family response regulator
LASTIGVHDWPGNIRELQNFIERAVILSPGPEFRLPPDELKRLVKCDTPSAIRTLAHAERDRMLHVLRQVSGEAGGRDGAAAYREPPCCIGCESWELRKDRSRRPAFSGSSINLDGR